MTTSTWYDEFVIPAAVLVLGIAVIITGAMAYNTAVESGEIADAVCEQHHGPEWHPLNSSIGAENDTIVCVAPNGTRVKTPRVVNVSGG